MLFWTTSMFERVLRLFSGQQLSSFKVPPISAQSEMANLRPVFPATLCWANVFTRHVSRWPALGCAWAMPPGAPSMRPCPCRPWRAARRSDGIASRRCGWAKRICRTQDISKNTRGDDMGWYGMIWDDLLGWCFFWNNWDSTVGKGIAWLFLRPQEWMMMLFFNTETVNEL